MRLVENHTGSVFCVDMVGWLILRSFVGERLILKGFVVVVVLGFTIVNVCWCWFILFLLLTKSLHSCYRIGNSGGNDYAAAINEDGW